LKQIPNILLADKTNIRRKLLLTSHNRDVNWDNDAISITRPPYNVAIIYHFTSNNQLPETWVFCIL